MGFSLVFRERVLEALGNRCCYRTFLFLFPVSVRISPPSYFLPFFLPWLPKKKVPPKKNDCSWFHGTPRATGWWTMTKCSLCMRQSGLLSNAQRRRNIGSTTSSSTTHWWTKELLQVIFCRWWSPKFCRGLDVSGGRFQWMEDRVLVCVCVCVCVCACVCVMIYFKCVRLVI